MAKKKNDMIANDVDPKTHLVKSEIKYIDPEKLIPYKFNARKHQSEIEILANIMLKVGFPDSQAIEVDKDMVIIKGHGRRLAAMKAGLKEVPYQVRDMSEKLARAYRIADNRISDLSGWDYDVLQMECINLKELDVDLNDFGFQDMGFDEPAVDDTETVVVDEDEITETTPVTTVEIEEDHPKTYKLGDHVIALKAVPEIINTLVVNDDDYFVLCSDVEDFREIIAQWEERTGEIAKKV